MPARQRVLKKGGNLFMQEYAAMKHNISSNWDAQALNHQEQLKAVF